MLSRKIILWAAWTAACMYMPALAVVDPVVKPLLVKNEPVVDKPLKANPLLAKRIDDGRVTHGAQCTQPANRSQPANQTQPVCQPIRSQRVGWWQRGPVRRGFARPFRWLFGRRGC